MESSHNKISNRVPNNKLRVGNRIKKYHDLKIILKAEIRLFFITPTMHI